MSDVLATILGGLIAGATGVGLQMFQESRRLSKIKSLLINGIRDDLKNAVSLYPKLEEDWQKSGIIWFSTLNEIRESRDIYVRNKDHITLFKKETLRQKVMQYYRTSGNTIRELENAQSRLHELETKYNQVRSEVVRLAPEDDEDTIKAKALRILNQEARQYDDIKEKTIPSLLNDAIKRANEAREIISDLENPKKV